VPTSASVSPLTGGAAPAEVVGAIGAELFVVGSRTSISPDGSPGRPIQRRLLPASMPQLSQVAAPWGVRTGVTSASLLTGGAPRPRRRSPQPAGRWSGHLHPLVRSERGMREKVGFKIKMRERGGRW
jgi:hypothetical protein